MTPEGGHKGEGLVEHLFRHESGKLLSALTRILGPRNLPLAEDVVQDVLCQALEVWKFHAPPDNPSAWLMQAARNRAIDLIRRERTRVKFAPDLEHLLATEWTLAPTVSALLDGELRDDQLRMMFSCCEPSLATDVQVALVLKILCGFSVAEIAHAFLASEAAIEKQLSRGKKVLQQSPSLFEVSRPDELRERMDSVHQALYLLFNEGYHATHERSAIREDLCEEAMRLALLLAEHPAGAVPRTHALVALFCFHAARLAARVDDRGHLVLLEAQDRTRWDRALIARGYQYLERSGGGELTEYHLEAAIAAVHCGAPTFAETNWARIAELYEWLWRERPSPIVALNRAIAIGYARGADEGLRALDAIEGRERLEDYPFLAAARAEFLRRAGRRDEAAAELRRAIEAARNPSEAELLESKLAALV
jgi:RNA polymerase sigma-70 factor (ECF subfamily)